MKKLTAIITAATIAMLTIAPAQAQMSGLTRTAPAFSMGEQLVQKTGKRHRGRIAAGIALGILGAAALAASSRRGYAEDRYESQYERRCNRLQDLCEDGSYRACRKYDRNC